MAKEEFESIDQRKRTALNQQLDTAVEETTKPLSQDVVAEEQAVVQRSAATQTNLDIVRRDRKPWLIPGLIGVSLLAAITAIAVPRFVPKQAGTPETTSESTAAATSADPATSGAAADTAENDAAITEQEATMLLKQAELLANKNEAKSLSDAIAIARSIPPNTQAYDTAQTQLQAWQEQLLALRESNPEAVVAAPPRPASGTAANSTPRRSAPTAQQKADLNEVQRQIDRELALAETARADRQSAQSQIAALQNRPRPAAPAASSGASTAPSATEPSAAASSAAAASETNAAQQRLAQSQSRTAQLRQQLSAAQSETAQQQASLSSSASGAATSAAAQERLSAQQVRTAQLRQQLSAAQSDTAAAQETLVAARNATAALPVAQSTAAQAQSTAPAPQPSAPSAPAQGSTAAAAGGDPFLAALPQASTPTPVASPVGPPPIASNSYGFSNVTVNASSVAIELRDNVDEDGDFVTLLVNGKTYANYQQIWNRGNVIIVPLEPGHNEVQVIGDKDGQGGITLEVNVAGIGNVNSQPIPEGASASFYITRE